MPRVWGQGVVVTRGHGEVTPTEAAAMFWHVATAGSQADGRGATRAPEGRRPRLLCPRMRRYVFIFYS